MDDSDHRLIKALFVLATTIGVLLTLFWGAGDTVGESASVLGRTYNEVMDAPRGTDKNLSPTEELRRATKKGSHGKKK